MVVSGVACPQGGWSAAVFYPLKHPIPYTPLGPWPGSFGDTADPKPKKREREQDPREKPDAMNPSEPVPEITKIARM